MCRFAKGFASSRAALRGSFEFYRARDATTDQNRQRMASKPMMPVLAIGGGEYAMDGPELVMRAVANDVQGLQIPGAGHFVAEEAPEQLLAALTEFLAPYRDAGPGR